MAKRLSKVARERLREYAIRNRHNARHSVWAALNYFHPHFVTPHDIAALVGLPFHIVLKGLDSLLKINSCVECDDGAEVLKFRSTKGDI